ncbi:MAG: NAD(P)H-dependent glycerol-3-phosphate dehydrogenase [Bacteroidales bacterium]|nr:NAD(P)H-dependent glycerol-3-phosphate dehydrogenase [Bacteroidales bacterium]
MNIAVMGGGSWATAIVKILTSTHNKIYWWVRETEIKEGVENDGYNPLYLSFCELEKQKISVSNDIHQVISEADIIFFVIPAAFLEISLQDVNKEEFKNKKIVSAIKGIVPSSNEIVSDYFHRVFDLPFDSLGVISGPSHAEEIASERLTYLTCASENTMFAEEIAKVIGCKFVKTVTSNDIAGIEYGAVMKNIYALAAGIAKGMNYGDNFVAVLISNAIQETERFLDAAAPKQRNIEHLVYLGDLLVTAYSQHSRNRTFGQMIGQGYSVKSAQLEMKMIAEGFYSAQCIHKANQQYGVTLPIAEAVYNILYEKKSPKKEFSRLLDKFC